VVAAVVMASVIVSATIVMPTPFAAAIRGKA
jgi:hypothetical protein